MGHRASEPTEVLTIRDVAAYLKLPVSTAYRLAERRELPGHKVGRQWRFHRSILDDWFRQGATTLPATLLVVDDEDFVRQFLVSALQAPQRHILMAASGKEALEIAESTDLDLALLDLLMPGMTGVETFERLRLLRPELPVIIVTGYPDSDLVAQALKIGPFTLVNKSTGLNHIQRAVEVMLGR